jgi:hypothetical protein
MRRAICSSVSPEGVELPLNGLLESNGFFSSVACGALPPAVYPGGASAGGASFGPLAGSVGFSHVDSFVFRLT